MKYSEMPDYLQYGACLACEDYLGAINALVRCLDVADIKQDFSKHADLMQRLGTVYFLMGNEDKALECFDASEDIDPVSLLPTLFYAKFLSEKLMNFQLAIRKCDVIIASVATRSFPGTDEDFSSNWYLRKAIELKEFCIQCESNGKRNLNGV